MNRVSKVRTYACAVLASISLSCDDRNAERPLRPQHLSNKAERYTSEPIYSTVVDGATDEPIAEAAVLVLWRKVDAYRESYDGIFRFYETTTDDRGAFSVPRWGPRPVDHAHYLDTRDPELWILRRGYLLGYFDNTGALEPRFFSRQQHVQRISKAPPREQQVRRGQFMRAAAGRSQWNGKTLALHKAETPEQESRSLAAAAPLDFYEPVKYQLPLFWSEWIAARNALGPPWAQSVEQPLPLSQRSLDEMKMPGRGADQP